MALYKWNVKNLVEMLTLLVLSHEKINNCFILGLLG